MFDLFFHLVINHGILKHAHLFIYVFMYVYTCLGMRGNYLELGGRRAYYKREVIRVRSLRATEANVGARSSRSRALLVAFLVMMRV